MRTRLNAPKRLPVPGAAMAVSIAIILVTGIEPSAWAERWWNVPSRSSSPPAADEADDAIDRAAAPDQASPILGTALTIVSDGTAPWEDRPLEVPGIGTLPGKRGVADPGDDTGPGDPVVRSWDTVTYRLAVSIRDAAVEDLVAEVVLSGPVVWDAQQVVALGLGSCRGGATVHDAGRRLRCVVGRIEAPPAVTIALDLSARVSGSAPQGAAITAAASVRGADVVPDPDPARCQVPRDGGCDATAPDVTVSSVPSAELRKFLVEVSPATVDGALGRSLKWRLDAVLGADGDLRGTSAPVGGPWTLPDWWHATGRGTTVLDLPVRLMGCTHVGEGAEWACDQPGGDGTPVEVTIEQLDLAAVMSDRAATTLAKVVGALDVELWVPEADLLATKWDVTFQNCFATAIGRPDEPLWAPVDAQGQLNLGGLLEPVQNNCAVAVLPVPRPAGPGGGGGGGGRERPRPPRTSEPVRPRPPRATPTPLASVTKRYTPIGLGDGVAEGTEFAAEVAVRVLADDALPEVIACDKWDNGTHTLREGGVGGVSAWWRNTDGELAEMDPDNIVVEFAKGPWGRQVPDHISVGERWYRQSVSTCTDSAAIAPPGWATADRVDFQNAGRLTIDARDVNMVRARFVDPVPPGVEVWIEVMLRAESNPAGAWLMNYGAGAWGQGAAGSPGSGTWQAEGCFGATGAGSCRACPKPAPGSRWRPGPLGDMLVHAGVPVWLRKQNDPPAPAGSPIILAGETAAFTLKASTFPKPGDPPPPDYPPGASAVQVVLTDTLPAGMTYHRGSATLSSEDMDGNGVLDPGEDLNGNGRIDQDVPFEPSVAEPAFHGATTLVWRLGDLPYATESAVIRYEARVSRLVRAGTALTNWVGVAAKGDAPPACTRPIRPRPLPTPFSALSDPPSSQDPAAPDDHRPALQADPAKAEQDGPGDVVTGLCAWAQVIVANAAAAQVEKQPRPAVVASGEDMEYRLGLANLATRPAEWFDAVDILPRPGEPRDPESRIGGGIQDISVEPDGSWRPIEVWASAADPDALDTAGGGVRDGLVDPVAAWGGGHEGGVGLGGRDWPCRLADVGSARCREIGSAGDVTALRLWGPDPQPGRTGTAVDSFLPMDGPPRFVDITLGVPGSRPGDVAHNAWGGRFEGLPLPVFDGAVIRVPPLPTPTPAMTPTPESSRTPTPAGSATPSSTATATAARTATRTATATEVAVHAIYLPTGLRLPCAPRPVDTALVIDVSSSMLRAAGDGGSKLDAVMRAAHTFLDGFEPATGGRRVAIAVFNERAWVVQPMTADRVRLDAATSGLAQHIAEGTRLDLGLLAGAEALGDAAQGRWRAMVFLTDGLPNRVPTPDGGGRQEDTVLAAAERVRAAAIEVYSVGYGRVNAPDIADRISPELLRAIAGDGSKYYETDDAGELAVVFRRIAAEIGCGRASEGIVHR